MDSTEYHILLIEDNPVDAFVMKMMLGKANSVTAAFKLTCADRLSEGLARLAEEEIDLVLLDLLLPDSEGLETLARVQTQAPGLPIAVLSGLNDEALAVQAVREGAQDYLVKGQVDSNLLARAIRYAIERKQAEVALRESEETARVLLNTPIESAILLDLAGTILALNAIAATRFGLNINDLIGACIYDLLPPNLAESRKATAAEVIQAAEPVRFEDEYAGAILDTIVYPIFDTHEKVARLAVFARDITERKRLEEMWRRFEFIVNTSKEFMTLINKDYAYEAVNDAYCRAHSKTPKEIVGKFVSEVWGEEIYFEKLKEPLDECLAGNEVDYQGWLKFNTLGSRYFNVTYYPYYNHEGIVTHAVVVSRDITDRKMSDETLRYKAFHDALTSLPNRALFTKRLTEAIKRAKQEENHLFAVLFLDLDHFKVVNDSLGHMVGDHLLIAIARRLEACVRPGDTVARMGGDEFTILLNGIDDLSNATAVARRIQDRLSAPFDLYGHEVFVTTSIGITLSSGGYDRPEEFLRDTDIAMYRAKTLGKARYEIFNVSMQNGAMTRLKLDVDLRRAVEREELELHYQPIVSLANCQIAGVEALLRWQHPQRGPVSPAEFIPVAEETGLIAPIGEWVLRTACAQIKAWHDAGYTSLRVAVNVSARQFQRQNLPQLIKKVLGETGALPQALELEITEGIAMMKNIDHNTAMLNELSDMGVQISIDDFGTGYSSLIYLKRFPVTTLKIDRSFISGITKDADNAAITTAIIAMTHSLKVKVIAEGVETAAQLAFLRAKRCDEIQGFLFSRPVPAKALTELLREGRSLLSATLLTPLAI